MLCNMNGNSDSSFLNPNEKCDKLINGKVTLENNIKMQPIKSFAKSMWCSMIGVKTNSVDSSHIPIYKNPIPLNNTGNSCYINSSLQALVPSFTKELNSALRQARNSNLPTISLLNTYLDRLDKGITWAPGHAIRNIKYFSKNLREGSQEDAQEFLNGMLDRLREEFNKIDNFKGTNNPVTKYFMPCYDRRYFCCSCKKSNYKSPQIHEELTFFLDMSDSLQNMINSYLRSSTDGYECENCKKSGLARMNATFTNLPKTFICCVKRFRYCSNSKIIREIQHSDIIKLPFINDQNEKQMIPYQLSSIVLHLGQQITGGHYECVSRLNNKWYHISDSYIQSIDKFSIPKRTQNSSYIYIFSQVDSDSSTTEASNMYPALINSHAKTNINYSSTVNNTQSNHNHTIKRKYPFNNNNPINSSSLSNHNNHNNFNVLSQNNHYIHNKYPKFYHNNKNFYNSNQKYYPNGKKPFNKHFKPHPNNNKNNNHNNKHTNNNSNNKHNNNNNRFILCPNS